jgi:hypothetical protein
MTGLRLARSCLLPLLLVGCSAGTGPPSEEEKPIGIHNTVRWKTASELDNYGFDVYRSTSEDGPFKTINDKPIAGAGTVDVPQRYKYVDRDIQADKAYYYYVESISLAGERKEVTPLLRAPPKNSDGREIHQPVDPG